VKLMLGRASMLHDEFECPLCKEVLRNPTDLRNHRLQKHRSILDEITFKNQQLKEIAAY
jgi:transcription initiation factor IIE alpha subunit